MPAANSVVSSQPKKVLKITSIAAGRSGAVRQSGSQLAVGPSLRSRPWSQERLRGSTTQFFFDDRHESVHGEDRSITHQSVI